MQSIARMKFKYIGEVPEWSNGADSKSVVPLAGTVGSNPTLSAIFLYRIKPIQKYD